MTDPFLTFALHAAHLRQVPRAGWLQRGVPAAHAESVAEHSFGVAFLAMLLADRENGIDPARVLRLAVVHDLAESLMGDLPASASALLGRAVKHAAEARAMEAMVEGLPHGEAYRALWAEYSAGESPEARLVKDADTLDMLLQALLYEEAGQRNLGEFWAGRREEDFHSGAARALFRALRERRAEMLADEKRHGRDR